MRAVREAHLRVVDHPLLGLVADRVLASIVHAAPETVAAARRERGLAPSRPRPNIDWASQPLGLEPDQTIADRLGISRQAVTKARRLRSIPAHRDRTVAS